MSLTAITLRLLRLLTTKGDLLGHTGSAHARLPIGIEGGTLIADPAASTGMRWTENSIVTVDRMLFDVPLNGAVDGDNVEFTLTIPPWPGTVVLHQNGLRKYQPDDYVVNTNEITFTVAPSPGDRLSADYIAEALPL